MTQRFYDAIRDGDINVVKSFIRIDKVDLSEFHNYSIRLASINSHLEIVKLLLAEGGDRVDPSAVQNNAIRIASQNGHVEVVKFLLSLDRVDPSDMDNFAIRAASLNGYAEVVKLLLSSDKVDPSTKDNEAIRMASIKGLIEVVKVLLTDYRVDPRSARSIYDDIIEILKADIEKYPTYAVRRHNLPLDQKIQGMENELDEIRKAISLFNFSTELIKVLEVTYLATDLQLRRVEKLKIQ